MTLTELSFLLSVYENIQDLKTRHGDSDENVLAIEQKFLSLAQNKLKITPGNSIVYQSQVNSPLNYFGGHLEIVFTSSIDYSFISNEHKELKNKLQIDNLKMELARLNYSEKSNLIRFHSFCVQAFYQIENLLNFFFHKKYDGNINAVLNYLEAIPGTTFHRKGTEISISHIPIATKIFAFGKTYFPNDYTGNTLNSIRLVRNEESHRCNVIVTDTAENKIKKFLQYKNYELVRTALYKLSEVIKSELQ